MIVSGLEHGSVGIGYLYDLHPDALVSVITGELYLYDFVRLRKAL